MLKSEKSRLAVAAGLGFGLGCLIVAWMHAAVGMTGYARWLVVAFSAPVIPVVGLILQAFRSTRTIGRAMLAGGAAMLVPLFVMMMRM